MDKRLWNKVIKHKGACWLWTGAISNGYGRVNREGKVHVVHRYVFAKLNGPVPQHLDVCHTCDTRNCVNPKHLFLGSRKDNMMDASRKGRLSKPKGEDSSNTKLTWAKVAEIREKYQSGGTTHRTLAVEYGVDNSTICDVINETSWKTL